MAKIWGHPWETGFIGQCKSPLWETVLKVLNDHSQESFKCTLYW